MRRFVTVIAVLLVATVAGVLPADARSAPRWQTVPGTYYDDYRVARAAGRAWIFVDNQNSGTGGARDRINVRSARIANDRLRSWVTTSLENSDRYLQVFGNQMLYSRPDGSLRSVQLKPDGTLGEPTAVAGAPMEGAPAARLDPVMVRLPDRVVWIVEENFTANAVRRLGCCDVNGAAVDYSSFLPPSVRTGDYTLGYDRNGRLWYAWTEGRRQEVERLKYIQLDPATLMPIGVPALAPVPPWVYLISMPCPDACYLVTESSRPRATSWRPGDRTVTKLSTLTKSTPGYGPFGVFAAGHFGGHLTYAYWADTTERGIRVKLARGNARGGNARIVRSIYTPSHVGTNSFSMGVPSGVLWPGGLVALEEYQDFSSSRIFLRAAVLRR